VLSLLLHGLGMRLDKVAVELGGLFFVPIASTCIAEDSLQCCVNEKISGPHLPWLLGYM